jgi:hypothetical protein
MFFILFSICLAAAVATDIYDVIMTEKGLKKGLALEAFTWLVGPKPSALKLYLRDSLVTGLVAAVSLIIFLTGVQAAAFGMLSGLVVLAIKHIHGGRQWAKLLAGGTIPNHDLNTDPGPALSAWQKFWQF